MARTSRSNIVQSMEDGTFWVEGETPIGTVNGSNTTFILANAPNPAGSLEVFYRGQRQRETTDFTISGDTLEMGFAPSTGSSLRVNYRIES